jgi:autophagy-related protein 9
LLCVLFKRDSAHEHEGLLERESVRAKDDDALRAVGDLDEWFSRLYAYFANKGYRCAMTSRVVNLATLGFTIWLSGFLLLFVDWGYLSTTCAEDAERCDVLRDAVYSEPYHYGGFVRNTVVTVYLLLFSTYWLWSAIRLAYDAAPLADMRRFCNQKLALSDRDLYTITWPEVLQRVVHLQATTRLCISRELNEHDIVARILRKENYLTGMVNREVLNVSLDAPLLRGHRWFTKVIEWNVDLAVFNGMFDENFTVKPSFYDVSAMRYRFRCLAIINAILSPFLAIFLSMYFVLSYAEKFYNNPSTVGTREWTSYAWWKMREFNELPHFTQHRLSAAYPNANKYVAQFPSPVVNILAKFVSYVVGSFAAIALVCAMIDDRLLQAYVGDRDVLWITAVLGTMLATSRSLMAGENTVFEPNVIMSRIVAHTHYLPKHWRDAAHKEEVQREFNSFFSLKAMMFLEEIASIFAAPFLLWFPLCESSNDIVQFVRQFTANKPGVGDVCSLSAFDFTRHGNKHYGAPAHASKAQRSRQGKLEKSFLTFQATYPQWRPDESGREMLNSLNGFTSTHEHELGKSADLSASVLRQSMRRYDAPLSSEKEPTSSFRQRGGGSREPAYGAGAMFQPASMTTETMSLVDTLGASQTVLQHYYEDRLCDSGDVDTAAENSPDRDEGARDDDNARERETKHTSIADIQMYQRPSPVAIVPIPMHAFPVEVERPANDGPSVLDSILLPNSTHLPPLGGEAKM